MHLRPATEADIAPINAIYNEVVRNSVAPFHLHEVDDDYRRRWLAEHGLRHPVIVAEQDGAVIAWGCLTQWSEREAYDATCENSIFVAESARGQGVGKALLAELIRLARENGMHTILARMSDGVEASIALHESLGYQRVGTMKEVGRKFGKLIDVHIYQLMLEKGSGSASGA